MHPVEWALYPSHNAHVVICLQATCLVDPSRHHAMPCHYTMPMKTLALCSVALCEDHFMATLVFPKFRCISIIIEALREIPSP